jgi:hypothetical protein
MRIPHRTLTVFVCSLIAVSALTGSALAALKDFGPLTAAGFPAWYRDNNNLPVQQCLVTTPSPTGLGSMCALTMIPLAGQTPPFDPALPVVFNSNWPLEAMYFTAENDPVFAIFGSTKTRIILALTSSFVNNVNPVPGEQMVFARVRVELRTVPPGSYTIIHPYGTENMTVDATGDARLTRDFPLLPVAGDFTTALAGDIGPFLKWAPDPGYPGGTNPDGTITVGGETFLGDPNVPHAITGSPTGNNFIRITGPQGANLDGNNGNVIQTSLFIVESRVIKPMLNVGFSFTGTAPGTGTVTSVPGGISCTGSAGGTTGTCSAPFDIGATVTLTAFEDPDTVFTGWSGACTNVAGDCLPSLLTAATSVTAGFTTVQPVRRDVLPLLEYATLGAAYAPVADGASATILVREATLTEPFTVGRTTSITLKGGYDKRFATNTGTFSSLAGILTIGNGILIVENFIIL